MRKQTVGERHILSGACLMAHATNMVVPSTEVMDKAEEAGLGSEGCVHSRHYWESQVEIYGSGV